jgi:hypothetical protein
MAIGYNPRVVTDGLVLALDAGNTKSYPGTGTTWTDLSGNSNNGTLTNGPTYSSANGGSLVFDGSDDYGSISSVTPDTGDFTIGFIYQLTGSTGRGGLFERKPTSPYNGFSLGQGASNNWAFAISGTSDYNNRIVVDFDYPSLNTWYFDVAVYSNGNTVSAYRNGSFVSSDTGTSQGNLSAQGTRTDFLIANRDLATSLPVKVAQVQVYNRALSASEVQQNFNALRGRFGI